MRHSRANNPGDRSNALWGRGSRGEQRSNALWGRGGRRAGVATASLVVLFAMAAGATAANGGSSGGNLKAYVPASLSDAITQNPSGTYDVIVQGDKKGNANGLYKKLTSNGTSAASVRQQFASIDGVQASLTGQQILSLAKKPFVTSVMPNEPVTMSAVQLPYSNPQMWAGATNAFVDYTNAALPNLPSIAVVDSGIQPGRADFGARVLTKANLVSLDVMNDQGEATVADVIKACDWILANKSTYNIRVANFSLHSANRASVLFDPLDQAVEKLWLNGVTVVAASGNYAQNGQASGVNFAPGNDPFVITVGASDIGTSLSAADDTNAPWSAWGYTPDGFMKPDLAAPGRYIIGPSPSNGQLALQRPGSVTAPGYMQLSGTSFSAPMVSGAAAMILAKNPSWTPDQVKAALMLTATPEPAAPSGSLGVGGLNIAKARWLNQNTK